MEEFQVSNLAVVGSNPISRSILTAEEFYRWELNELYKEIERNLTSGSSSVGGA